MDRREAANTVNKIWIVVFRNPGDTEQKELVRYTRENAYSFAEGIIDSGGVAIVVEGFERDREQAKNLLSLSKKPRLIW